MAQKPLIKPSEQEEIAALSAEQIEERLKLDVQQYVAFYELVAKHLKSVAQLQARIKLYIEALQAKGVVIEGLEALKQDPAEEEEKKTEDAQAG